MLSFLLTRDGSFCAGVSDGDAVGDGRAGGGQAGRAAAGGSRLLDAVPPTLQRPFLSDAGSVALLHSSGWQAIAVPMNEQ